MKVTLSVTELTKVFKEIQAQPERIFEMMQTEITQGIGEYRPSSSSISGNQALYASPAGICLFPSFYYYY